MRRLQLGGTEELGFDENSLSNNEFWSHGASSIGKALILELSFGNGGSEFLVKFVQIDY